VGEVENCLHRFAMVPRELEPADRRQLLAKQDVAAVAAMCESIAAR